MEHVCHFSLQWSQHAKVAEERLHPLAWGTRRALRGTETLCGASSQLPQPPPPSPHQVPEEELPPPAPPFTREWLHQHRLPAGLILNALNQQMFCFHAMFIFFNNLPTNKPPLQTSTTRTRVVQVVKVIFKFSSDCQVRRHGRVNGLLFESLRSKSVIRRDRKHPSPL